MVRRTTREWAVLAMALVALVGGFLFCHIRLDDAYITYRYGQNLARGLGLVFNPGERVLGTTAPGHALLVGLVYAVGGHVWTPTLMAYLGTLAWGGQAIVLFRWPSVEGSRGIYPWLMALPLLVGTGGSYRWVPLETNMAFLAALGCLAAASASRWSWAGLLGALACMARPDNVLVLAIALGLGVHRREFRSLPRFLLAPAVVGGAWVVFAMVYYGSPLPITLGAKAKATSMADYVDHLAWTFPSNLLHIYPEGPLKPLVWILAAIGAGALWVHGQGLASLVVFFVLHTTAYAIVLRPKTDFPWHFYPDQALFSVFAMVGLYIVVRSFVRVLRRDPTLEPVRAAMVVTALGCGSGIYGAYQFARSHDEEYWYGLRDRAYHLAAPYIVDHIGPNETIAAEEVGTLAYLTDRRFYDFPGLVTPFRLLPDPITKAQREHDIQWVVVPTGLLPGSIPAGSSLSKIRLGRWSVSIVHLAPLDGSAAR